MTEQISQRELRNDSGRIMRAPPVNAAAFRIELDSAFDQSFDPRG